MIQKDISIYGGSVIGDIAQGQEKSEEKQFSV
jgi:hypothetical protein